MNRIRIIADNKIPFLKGVLEPVADVAYLPGREISSDLVKDADALIIRTRTRCNASLLKGSKVRFIASATIGYDHIDTDYCKANGIEWTNAPGCNSSSVEQYIVSALLYIGRKRKMKLSGKTLGVVGVGYVGTKVSRIGELLGMRVLKNDPPRARKEGRQEFLTLNDVLEESDIVTLHVPLHRTGPDKTHELVNAHFIASMKEGAILINSSRGEVLDEDAVKEAVSSGHLKDIILDVYCNEPEIDRELLELSTMATPHIAGYSSDGKANGTMMAVRAVSRFFSLGLDIWKPENIPDPETSALYLDASGADLQDVLWTLYSQTYDISLDHENLKKQAESFEKLRETYRVRREPGAYTVKVFNGDSSLNHVLEGLGFTVIGDSCF